MSLQVQNLTKKYGQQKAVDNISFSIKEGEIVGFLGPNGAGKSTTMKVITGYLPPLEGKVILGGVDVVENPIRVKKMIGYLPEHNPLYLDMYVHEYLSFVGGVYGLAKEKLKDRTKEIVSLCGLVKEQNKRLEALSKGYRQRVGLAQALIHDPQVLILDEPTSGLDPNQIVEIRNVIKEISKNKTVLFSTHIMQEVQALCDRVIVINKGKLIADDKLESLLKNKDHSNTLIIEFKEPVTADTLKEISDVDEIVALNESKFKLIPKPGVDLRNDIFRFASEKDLSLTELKVEENTMETIFKELTDEQLET